MLQIAYIRQHTELVKQKLTLRSFNNINVIDELIQLDDQRKKTQFKKDELLSKVNATSKEIGVLLKEGRKEEAAQKKNEVAVIREQLNDAEDINELEKAIHDILVQIPNLPSEKVPPGRTAEDNIVVKAYGNKPDLYAGAVPHWELAKQYDLIDFEAGNKITGSGFPVYKNKGAKLQRALIQFFLDYNTNAGYIEYLPPFMVNEASAFGTGQLPDKEGQMYYATEDKLYLIPTAEVPLTNIYRNDIVKESELPIKMTAYTPCFRREAGSYGKDVRGLNRVHQFDKVEIVQLVNPAKSYDHLDEMVLHVEHLLQLLDLPYRILRLCGGDMGFTSALTYDFEVYSAAQNKWLEVSSVSNFESYQTNRMKIRFKDTDGKTQLLHSLNGSSLALPRIVACLLENNQKESGIVIPEALQHYFGISLITR